MNIIIMGAPASGKGTQARRISEMLAIPHISTGDLFRKNIEKGGEHGKLLAELMNKGELIPDQLVSDVIGARLEDGDCDNGFILDGYPRNIDQTKSILSKHKIDLVLYLHLDEKLLIERVSHRKFCADCGATFIDGETCGICGGNLVNRKDDNKEVLEVRLKNYHKSTMPILEYFKEKNMLTTIDGEKSIDEIASEIKKVIALF